MLSVINPNVILLIRLCWVSLCSMSLC